jgi:hypothetical protein
MKVKCTGYLEIETNFGCIDLNSYDSNRTALDRDPITTNWSFLEQLWPDNFLPYDNTSNEDRQRSSKRNPLRKP